MAFTQQQHDILEAAIAQGALKVEYGDKKVTYQSLTDMLRILKLMKADLGLNPAGNGRKLASFSKGICSDFSDIEGEERWIR